MSRFCLAATPPSHLKGDSQSIQRSRSGSDQAHVEVDSRQPSRNARSSYPFTLAAGAEVTDATQERHRVGMTDRNDLISIAKRLAARGKGRSEATIQSDIRQFLMTAPFDLEEDHIDDAPLEVPVGDGRRIDIEVGFTVIEVKKDLRSTGVLDKAKQQLSGYLATRIEALNQDYIGILTDGSDWIAYHLSSETIIEVSRCELNASPPEIDELIAWLEGVLATSQQVEPTPREIENRLGARSSSHSIDRAALTALYDRNRSLPTVVLKRKLWAKLLTTALGTQFEDSDELFVEHTLLVNSAEIIAHAVVGFDLSECSPASLLSGTMFSQAQINGVVEADFFDWVVEVKGGDRLVRAMARRLSRFAWSHVEHDVMKVLYESIIEQAQRKKLGEYYTPDWLAARIVDEAINDPLQNRVLDPACGSGTFLFHAVRKYLDSSVEAGDPVSEQVLGVTQRVFGMDIHPVAVTLARVTYLLAIGRERLQGPDRPPMTVPVFLGDSIQWNQRVDLFTQQVLTVPTDDGNDLFSQDLRFPESLLEDVSKFDRLVSELATRASKTRTNQAVPSLSAVFRRYAVPEADQSVITETFQLMCSLHDEGRNHIWGYFVRNVARPVWFSKEGNRPDVLIGNPPWLAYRYMTPEMQAAFRELSADRGLWHGASVATHQDLSALFVARAAQLYLRPGGHCAFVLPEAVLSRKQYRGFRAGRFASDEEPMTLSYDRPWSLHAVKPSFFPVPAAVVFGVRKSIQDRGDPLDSPPLAWRGKLPGGNLGWSIAEPHLEYSVSSSGTSREEYRSPYRARFANGATVIPRMLFMAEEAEPGPLGSGAGRVTIRSSRSNLEKRPWKGLPSLTGTIEGEFLRPLLLGSSILPFATTNIPNAVIPWDGKRLLHEGVEQLDLYPGLAAWWRQASAAWLENRSSDRLSLIEQLDYRKKLSDQFPTPDERVVYTASGMYLAACLVSDTRIVVDKALYWGTMKSVEEGRFLCAILNSPVATRLVRPLQARGEHNPRHFDKYIWKLPIPEFDGRNEDHKAIARLAGTAEELVASLSLPTTKRFETVRRYVREQIAKSAIGQEIDDRVRKLLGREE